MLLRLLNLSQKQRQFWYWIFTILAIASFLLIIMVAPCVTQIGWQKQIYNPEEQLKIVMMVLFPFFFGIIFSLLADMFRIYTTEDALRQVDIMSDYGKIYTEDRNLFQKRIHEVQLQKEKEAAESEASKQRAKLEQAKMSQQYKQDFNKLTDENEENQRTQ